MSDKAVLVNPLRYYLFGTGSWFLGFGIQSVTFAWLVTMVLRASPEMVGIAQMTLLIPTLLLVLVGGGLADYLGGRRVALVAQSLAVLPPLLLALTIYLGQLSYAAILAYAVAMGSLNAFLTPARDGLLNEVASGTIQRAVVRTTMIQFGAQMVGFILASFAETWGAATILSLQAAIFLIGVMGFARIPPPSRPPERRHVTLFAELRSSIADGYRTVAADRALRNVVLQNMAMGLCFMGAYIVTLPLLVREAYQGGSVELGWMNAVNSLGFVLVVTLMMRKGDLARPGRALILAQALGAIILAAAGLGVPFATFIGLILIWGMFGGIAMSMSRTLVQERAPADRRARVMSFYTLSLIGAGPVGALVNGLLVEALGPQRTLMVVSAVMFAIMLFVALGSNLWGLKSHAGNA